MTGRQNGEGHTKHASVCPPLILSSCHPVFLLLWESRLLLLLLLRLPNTRRLAVDVLIRNEDASDTGRALGELHDVVVANLDAEPVGAEGVEHSQRNGRVVAIDLLAQREVEILHR